MNRIVMHAHAKVNLGLEVLRKRPDGYHDIRSVFVPLGLHDVVTVEPADTLTVVCLPEVTSAPEENLVWKAATAVFNAAGCRQCGAKITVEKHIPAGGGLGGGSSDAASTLLGLDMLFGWNLPKAVLHELACSLGSDVPFFLQPAPAIVSGRGDVVVPIDVHIPWSFVLVFPGIHISTPWAYRQLGRTETHAPTSRITEEYVKMLTNKDVKHIDIINDFESVVFLEHPELSVIKQQLIACGAKAAWMSGSGSTIVGLFASATPIDVVAMGIPYPHHVTRATSIRTEPR